MKRVIAINPVWLLLLLPVFASGLSFEMPERGCTPRTCCALARCDGESESSYGVIAEEEKAKAPRCHRHDRLPLMRDVGERRAASQMMPHPGMDLAPNGLVAWERQAVVTLYRPLAMRQPWLMTQLYRPLRC